MEDLEEEQNPEGPGAASSSEWERWREQQRREHSVDFLVEKQRLRREKREANIAAGLDPDAE